jgi:hypothetical protein
MIRGPDFAQLFANIVLLLLAGHENSTSLIGNGAATLLGLPEVRRDLEDFMPPGRPFRMVTRQLHALTAAVPSLLARSSHLTAAHLESTPLSCSCGADGDDLALRREGSARPEMDVKNKESCNAGIATVFLTLKESDL